MHATEIFPAHGLSPRRARQWLVNHLEAWVPGTDSGEAALLLSEVATNAVVHAKTPFIVEADVRGDRLRVEVADADLHMPAPAELSLSAEGGRGLILVDQMAAAWGAELSPTGKVVWFELPVSV